VTGDAALPQRLATRRCRNASSPNFDRIWCLSLDLAQQAPERASASGTKLPALLTPVKPPARSGSRLKSGNLPFPSRQPTRKERTMNKHPHEEQKSPAEMLATLGVNGATGKAAAQAFQSWLAGAGEAQSHVFEYWSRRCGSDSAAFGKIAQCKTPAEVWAAQIEWANALYSDLADEGRYVAERFSRAAQESLHIRQR
jgi:hypothetical protein